MADTSKYERTRNLYNPSASADDIVPFNRTAIELLRAKSPPEQQPIVGRALRAGNDVSVTVITSQGNRRTTTLFKGLTLNLSILAIVEIFAVSGVSDSQNIVEVLK